MGNYIIYGNCNKKLTFLVLYTIATILLTFILIELYIKFECDGNKNALRLKKNYLYNFFLEYLGYLLCFIPEIFRRKYLKKKEKQMLNSVQRTTSFVNYIFNDPLDVKTLSNKEIIFCIIICLLSLIKRFSLMFIDIMMGSEDNEDYNFIEYVFFYLALIFIFKKNIYKHQCISIIILVVLGIFKYLFKILSSNNEIDSKPEYYIYIIFILNIVNSLLTCIIYGFIKGLMEYKFFSIYKCTYIFGFIDVPIIIILYFIFSYFPSKNSSTQFLTVEYNEKYYFDNIYSLFRDFKLIDYISSFLYIIGSGLLQILITKIIDDFTILHIALPFEIHEFIYNIIETINKKWVLNIIIICTVFESFFFSIFLEIFELNFCKLNYNTERNIKIRALTETIIDNQDEGNDTSNSINEGDNSKTKKQEVSQDKIFQN